MIQNTLPDRNTGDAILVALSVANIVMLVSPAIIGLFAALQVLPESIRRRASTFFVGPADAVEAKVIGEPEQPLDADVWQPPVIADLGAVTAGNADATHIELAALSADSWQPADVNAWHGNAMFGLGLSAAVPTTTGTFFEPTAVQIVDAPSIPPGARVGEPIGVAVEEVGRERERERELIREIATLREQNQSLIEEVGDLKASRLVAVAVREPTPSSMSM